MSVDIKVPQLGESVSEATVATWFKKKGDTVQRDEPLVELETDKVTMEVFAPASGVLSDVLFEEGADVEVGAILGKVEEGEGAPPPEPEEKAENKAETIAVEEEEEDAAEPAADTSGKRDADLPLSPAVRKLVEENDLDPAAIEGSGKDGRLTKGDVQKHLEEAKAAPAEKPAAREEKPKAAPAPARSEAPAPRERVAVAPNAPDPEGREERVTMTRLRKRIAERLKAAQDTAAMLTTFNEVDMTNVMAARKQYQERFEKKHGVRLGFMSFFVKAAIQALQDIPAVNGEIAGDEIVYKHYYHIGVAVSSPQGLIVPVLRDADAMSFAGIESAIGEMGRKARDGELTPDDLTGGTFTISNGGIFGSLMSTPILNPPQSGILGMHKIEERPVARDGQVVIRPMMYLALSYDHRIVDGREAVTFLVRIKDAIEDPQRLLLEV
ncbi:MAG: 2-oxoglutarate dehydrogenase complex dihydrolipoyllysine-residue succinyltransferase [Proteobacteria bacterium]|nr:2-oxoglutarate dehydrogenase complex dihydrolipoyllysine-residue succinyltransferase [Pseudomonadota bacterium]